MFTKILPLQQVYTDPSRARKWLKVNHFLVYMTIVRLQFIYHPV